MSIVMLVMANGDNDDEGCKGPRALGLRYHLQLRMTTKRYCSREQYYGEQF